MNGNYTNTATSALNGTNTASTPTTDKFGTANSAMNFSNPTSTAEQYATHPIHASTSFSGTQNFTITFLFYISTPWIQNSGLYDNCLNYGSPGIYVRNVGANPNLQFNYKNGSVGSTQLTTGIWWHGTFVRNNGVLSIYINGILNATASEGSVAPTYSYPARFGTMFYHTYPHYNPLNGKLDEFRIYNRALTASEISGLAFTTLPLTLGDFTAVKLASSVKLNWQTLTETNTSYFIVERSADATVFTSVGTVNAAGNSAGSIAYNFTDNAPLAGTSFYRLKMVDIDQTFTYSRVVAVKNETEEPVLQLFPNPVSNLLQLQIPSHKKQKAGIIITNTNGNTVYRKEIQLAEGNNGSSIPVDRLPAGIYLLHIEYEAGRFTQRFIKK
jgi:hypothetical protein